MDEYDENKYEEEDEHYDPNANRNDEEKEVLYQIEPINYVYEIEKIDNFHEWKKLGEVCLEPTLLKILDDTTDYGSYFGDFSLNPFFNIYTEYIVIEEEEKLILLITDEEIEILFPTDSYSTGKIKLSDLKKVTKDFLYQIELKQGVLYFITTKDKDLLPNIIIAYKIENEDSILIGSAYELCWAGNHFRDFIQEQEDLNIFITEYYNSTIIKVRDTVNNLLMFIEKKELFINKNIEQIVELHRIFEIEKIIERHDPDFLKWNEWKNNILVENFKDIDRIDTEKITDEDIYMLKLFLLKLQEVLQKCFDEILPF